MIVGCYVLHLYCDHKLHVKKYYNEEAEYTGPTKGVAEKGARVDGWKFTKDGKVFCETCKRIKP